MPAAFVRQALFFRLCTKENLPLDRSQTSHGRTAGKLHNKVRIFHMYYNTAGHRQKLCLALSMTRMRANAHHPTCLSIIN